jgi:hypothetical protein
VWGGHSCPPLFAFATRPNHLLAQSFSNGRAVWRNQLCSISGLSGVTVLLFISTTSPQAICNPQAGRLAHSFALFADEWDLASYPSTYGFACVAKKFHRMSFMAIPVVESNAGLYGACPATFIGTVYQACCPPISL